MKRWYDELWYPTRPRGPLYRLASATLWPAERAFRAAVALRAWLHDRGWLREGQAPLPTLAVGNLTVGGTGKTPMTAWFARELGARGSHPAVVLRDYGGDEGEVHRRLNSDVPVYADPHRIDAVHQAAREGADVVILDDAFQHRALRSDRSVVLIAAEEWTEPQRLLPRGPWREPVNALQRASMVVITRKTAPVESALKVTRRLRELLPELPRARAHIGVAGLARYDLRTGSTGPPHVPQDLTCVLGIAGVARPAAVWAQLAEIGVTIEERRSLPDHHSYTPAERAELNDFARKGPLVMTLKDAVKVAHDLDPGSDIFIPLQEIRWEAGRDHVENLIDTLSRASRSPAGERE